MENKDMTRRQFLKFAGGAAALLGLSEAFVPQIAHALEGLMNADKPPVIWIQGQNCTGCSVSFLNSDYPMVAEVVLDKLSVRYHPNVMAGAGYPALKAIRETAAKGGYVLICEGPVPTAEEGRFCTFGVDEKGKDITYREWVEELAPNAAAVIANGNCAAFGGIPAANADVTGTKPISAIVNRDVINVGGCPSHPDWIIGTVLEYLTTKKVDVDSFGRPKLFFSQTIHENCPRRGAFDAGIFLEDWNQDQVDMEYCLFKMGCKGPVTYADCPVRRWNSKTNWCVGANAPCHGCCEPNFYQDMSPLYEPLPNLNMGGLTPGVDAVGWAAAGLTAAGIGSHYLAKQLGHKPEEGEE
ncbi:MAG: hydrogenase small subunit [Candidatus Geothermincolia bacterium]